MLARGQPESWAKAHRDGDQQFLLEELSLCYNIEVFPRGSQQPPDGPLGRSVTPGSPLLLTPFVFSASLHPTREQTPADTGRKPQNLNSGNPSAWWVINYSLLSLIFPNFLQPAWTILITILLFKFRRHEREPVVLC